METSDLADNALMQLGKILKKKLQDNDVMVTELSRATKVPLQTLHNWLAGQKPRDIDQVKRVADHFGVSINNLCFGEIEKANRELTDFRDEILAGVFEVVIRKPKR
jgi:hypothetical protein